LENLKISTKIKDFKENLKISTETKILRKIRIFSTKFKDFKENLKFSMTLISQAKGGFPKEIKICDFKM